MTGVVQHELLVVVAKKDPAYVSLTLWSLDKLSDKVTLIESQQQY